MHELAIAQSILEIAQDEARKNVFRRITGIKLRIGRLTAVETGSLTFCFELISKGTTAEGALLEIESVPIGGRCKECHAEFGMDQPWAVCPFCEDRGVVVISGRELTVTEIDGTE